MKNKNKQMEIILLGGGGHCKVIIDALKRNNSFILLGIIDNDSSVKKVSGAKVIGNDKSLKRIYMSGCKHAFIAVGSTGDPSVRISLFSLVKKIGFSLPAIKHPSAIISKSAKIGKGSFVAAKVNIGPYVSVGKNAIINTGASIDHDCQISDFVHIAPGVILCGGIEIGRGTHVGAGSTIIENIKIGSNTIIGAGSVVVSDISSNKKAYGNPCRIIGVK